MLNEADERMVKLFSSPNGEQVLDDLKGMFMDGKMFMGADTHTTAYRIGQHDVIGFIIDTVEEAKGGEGTRVGTDITGDG